MFRPFDVKLSAFADGAEHLLAVAVHPAPHSESQVGFTRRVRAHKSRMGYGWDFCPRIVNQGIWQPVELADGPERFPTVVLRGGEGIVELEGEVVLRVREPELWWPNGLGEQRLYPVEIDGQEIQVGFRTVEVRKHAFVVNG